VVAAMQDVVRFWLERGVDGFRLDAIDKLIKDDRLRNDPPATATFPLPLRGEAATLEHVYSAHRPEAIAALAAIRSVAGDALLVGEVFQPTSAYPPYLEVLDLVFAFEFLFAPWDAERLRAAIAPAAELRRVAWVMSNHDFDRLATRVGPDNLPCSSTKATRSGSRTAPAPTRRTTARGGTRCATRCSGTPPRAGASRPVSPGFPRSIPRSGTSRRSVRTPTRSCTCTAG